MYQTLENIFTKEVTDFITHTLAVSERLKTLNQNRRYNPENVYFCEACIQRAKVQQTLEHTAISDQNAATYSIIIGSSDGSSKDAIASSNIGRHKILRLHN